MVALGSGAEERNARWAHSRRRYDAGYGVKTFDALSQVLAFFEERRGRLYGFRWRDRLDHSSATPGAVVMPTDQVIGTGDGATAVPAEQNLWRALFALSAADRQTGAGSVRVAVAGSRDGRGCRLSPRCDDRRRHVSRRAAFRRAAPRSRAGFLFDVPVRFDTDYLELDLSAFAAGAIPKIPLVEIRP